MVKKHAKAKVKFTGCCRPFNPQLWDDKVIHWKGKLFVKDHVVSLFHIPLNMGSVIVRNMGKIKAAGATGEQLMLSDECSMFGSDIYIAVKKPVPGAKMAKLSGTFLTEVYRGDYKDMGKWIADFPTHAVKRGKKVKKMYFYYTMCPHCAKAYGQNYTVIVGQIA
jgi:hypothetical protein